MKQRTLLFVGLLLTACGPLPAPPQQEEVTPSIPDSAIIEETSQIEATDWQRYVNREFRFSVLYPAHWSVVDITMGAPPAIGFASPESAEKLIEPWDWAVGFPSKTTQWNSIESYLVQYGKRPPNEIRKDVRINGRNAVLLEIPFAVSNSVSKTVYIESDERIYTLNGHLFSAEDTAMFDQFYLSFEIIEE
jgi:hypothetical protein